MGSNSTDTSIGDHAWGHINSTLCDSDNYFSPGMLPRERFDNIHDDDESDCEENETKKNLTTDEAYCMIIQYLIVRIENPDDYSLRHFCEDWDINPITLQRWVDKFAENGTLNISNERGKACKWDEEDAERAL